MGFMPENKPVASTPVIKPNTPGITAKETAILVQPDELLTKRKYVINTQNNNTGVNTERLATVVADLRGFAEGSLIHVTYYKEMYSETDVKGRYDHTEGALNHAHKSVLKINGFEMKMAGPLSYTHNTDDTVSQMTGEAFTYPGFEPEKDDRFVMEVDTGKYAMMQLTDPPTRMSIRANTYYKIAFKLTDWISEVEIAEVEQGVVDEAWFDKQRFLNEPGALLNHDEYVELKFLKAQRAKMVQFYRSKFLDELLMYSYMRPDKIYDPYVTDFMLSTQDVTELAYYAKQLYGNAPYIKDNIWTAIRDADIPLEAVPTLAASSVYRLGSKTVLANSLINKKYLFWTDSESLADYIANLDRIDGMYVPQTYPSDFAIAATEYVLTTDKYFSSRKSYFTRSGSGTDEDPYVYSKSSDYKYGQEIPTNTYYTIKAEFGFKEGKTYYTRINGIFYKVIPLPAVPDPNVQYYLRRDEDPSGSGSSGTGGDPSIPSIDGGTPNEERTLGDLLLHLHPHYNECPLVDGDTSSSGTTSLALDLILGGDNDHIDLIIGWLKTREIDLTKLHACIEKVWKMSRIQQFYKMPVYMYLAARAMVYIHHSEAIFEKS